MDIGNFITNYEGNLSSAFNYKKLIFFLRQTKKKNVSYILRLQKEY